MSVRDRLEKENLKQLEEQNQCGSITDTPATLIDQIRSEKARVSRKLRDRIHELDQAERLLMNSDAETIIKDAQEVLWKGEKYV